MTRAYLKMPDASEELNRSVREGRIESRRSIKFGTGGITIQILFDVENYLWC